MPTVGRKINPYRAGDVVTMANTFNGSKEGVLWRVNKVTGNFLWIAPILTLTGPSVLNPKRVTYNQVDAVDLIGLATIYAQLGNLIADIARRRSE